MEKKKVQFTTISELRKALPPEAFDQKDSKSRDFYVTTKPIVDRILILSKTGNLFGEMKQVSKEEERSPTEPIIWNGSVPLTEESVLLILLGGEGTAEYLFNDLFSKPINVEILKMLADQEVETFRNTVVVNVPRAGDAPQSVKQVLLEFPATWQSFWKFKPLEMMTYIPPEKIKIEGKQNPSDFFKIGFDPSACTWVRSFDLPMPSKGLIESMTTQSMDDLVRTNITVCCYVSMIQAKYTFSKDGNKMEVFQRAASEEPPLEKSDE